MFNFRGKILLPLILLWPGMAGAQQAVVLSGFIEDRLSGERLAHAALSDQSGRKGVYANAYGYFSISLPKGENHLLVSYVGYRTDTLSLTLLRDTTIHVLLEPSGHLPEVTVGAHSNGNAPPDIGKHRFSIEHLKAMPSMLGETDVLKALQSLPGVNQGTEGMSGFSVRGGSPEQTQILLDGVPVYNVNHAFGYLSVFNGEALKDVALYKGNIPALYGGRLSSVLDVTMKEGNLKKYTGRASLSPLAGAVTFEGPIKKDRASFIISGRRTWIDLLLKLYYSIADTEYATGYNFYDLNFKTNWIINSRNRIYVSAYHGRDNSFVHWSDLGNKDKYRYNWGNITLSGRWNTIIHSRLFANTTLYYSRFKYNNRQSLTEPNTSQRYTSGASSDLQEVTLKSDFNYQPHQDHTLRFGAALSYQHYAPEVSFRSALTAGSRWKDESEGDTWSATLYLEDEWSISERWQLRAGIRTSILRVPQKTYCSLEPRIAISRIFSDRSSLTLSWSNMQQPLHLLSNSSMDRKTDLWVPATRKIKPGYSNLLSLGYRKSFNHGVEFTTEIYYNDIRRTIRYEEGIRYLKEREQSWQDYVYIGKGRSYGLEMMLHKQTGKLTGWISYALSKSERSFDRIQAGKWFPFEYDRRHKINAVANYRLNDKDHRLFYKMVSLNFVYSSGSYTTIGRQSYSALPMFGGNPDNRYSAWWEAREYINHPNNYRLPAYHHLDIAFHWENKASVGSSWSVGIYNVYFRENPSFCFRHVDRGVTEYRQFSLMPFLPFVRWSYKF